MDAALMGRYTPAEVARLLGMSPATVRRWLASSPSIPGERAVVVRDGVHGGALASFLDLVELSIADELVRRFGLRTALLRASLREASRRLGLHHPLARRQFLVEGRRLHLPMTDGTILELGSGGQLGLNEVIRTLARAVEFDPDGLARKWWPLGEGGPISVAPDVAFGAPVVEGSRLEVATLVDLCEAEGGDIERVAWLYELSPEVVRQAVGFGARRAA